MYMTSDLHAIDWHIRTADAITVASDYSDCMCMCVRRLPPVASVVCIHISSGPPMHPVFPLCCLSTVLNMICE